MCSEQPPSLQVFVSVRHLWDGWQSPLSGQSLRRMPATLGREQVLGQESYTIVLQLNTFYMIRSVCELCAP